MESCPLPKWNVCGRMKALHSLFPIAVMTADDTPTTKTVVIPAQKADSQTEPKKPKKGLLGTLAKVLPGKKKAKPSPNIYPLF